MQIKTLRYSHMCKRSFDAQERASEQGKLATEAFLTRNRGSVAIPTLARNPRQPDYSKLLDPFPRYN